MVMFSLIEVAQLLDYVLRLDLVVADPPEQLSAAMPWAMLAAATSCVQWPVRAESMQND